MNSFPLSVLGQDLARVGCCKDRLQSAGDVAGEQADRADRRDRDQVAGAPDVDVHQMGRIVPTVRAER